MSLVNVSREVVKTDFKCVSIELRLCHVKRFHNVNVLSSLFFSCREKKDSEVHSLEGHKEAEAVSLQGLEADNEAIRQEIDSMKAKYLRVSESHTVKFEPLLPCVIRKK